MKLFAKIIDGLPVTTCADEEDTDLIAQLLADSFKPYDDSAEPPVVGEFQAAVADYHENAKQITLRWKTVKNNPEKIAAEIARLQSELAATDYRVVKSYEFALAGEKPPYDPAALHSDRQAIRDRIGELEARQIATTD
jgi:hypothetical protein